MARQKDIDRFLKDAKRAGKVAGSHVPVVKEGLSVYDTYEVISNLRRSTPKAARAAKNELLRRIRKRQQRLKRRFKLR